MDKKQHRFGAVIKSLREIVAKIKVFIIGTSIAYIYNEWNE